MVHPRDRRLVRQWLTIIVSCLLISLCTSTTRAARLCVRCLLTGSSKANSTEARGVEWLTDYSAAYAKAKREKRMLLVNFVPDGENAAQHQLDSALEKDSSLRSRLRSMVLVRVPADYESQAENYDGRLADHPAFRYLSGRTGVAIIDLKHPQTEYYGDVVTALPFNSGKYYRWKNSHFKTALSLPPGTITQRTMVWAVRIHPEAPASTTGHCDRALVEAAEGHSEYQARIQIQGHQNFMSRYHQVRAATDANDASEVVAESWPNQNLIDSCIDCVDSWRHSPGHWGAVRGRQRLFGYDIRRGRNGIWYGTGIFAN